jgi:hypothetical protein
MRRQRAGEPSAINWKNKRANKVNSSRFTFGALQPEKSSLKLSVSTDEQSGSLPSVPPAKNSFQSVRTINTPSLFTIGPPKISYAMHLST